MFLNSTEQQPFNRRFFIASAGHKATVSAQIHEELLKRVAKFNLILDDVSITHLTFGREFARAIENKQVAQQEAETQAYHVARADQERKAAGTSLDLAFTFFLPNSGFDKSFFLITWLSYRRDFQLYHIAFTHQHFLSEYLNCAAAIIDFLYL